MHDLARARGRARVRVRDRDRTVSYTHLKMPIIFRVFVYLLATLCTL